MKKYELTTLQGKDIVLDISHLLKEEVISINVTKLAKQFGKSRNMMYQFFNSDGFKEYMKAYSNVTENSDVKLIEKREGRYGGTYVHSDVILPVLRYLSPEFAVRCDLYIKYVIQQSHDEKVSARASISANKANDKWLEARDHGKDTRKLFTDKVKEFCEYAEEQRGEPYKLCPYYKHITDAIYAYIGVSAPKADQSPRDVYSGDVVEAVEVAELETIRLLEDVMNSGGSRKGIKQRIVERLKQGDNQ